MSATVEWKKNLVQMESLTVLLILPDVVLQLNGVILAKRILHSLIHI